LNRSSAGRINKLLQMSMQIHITTEYNYGHHSE